MPDAAPDPSLPTEILRLSDLRQRRATRFDIAPDAAARAALARALDIPAIRKLRFAGALTPMGRQDWQLDAELGATVELTCVVTLQPITERIDTQVLRRYLADWSEPAAGGEVEMPEDDTAEPLPASLDLIGVLAEALALALPDFPRAPGVSLGEAVFAAPGAAPMRDEDARPFAGLAGLRDRLGDGETD